MIPVLVNCTYCAHRVVHKKALEGKYELELCRLTHAKIPHPSQPGRHCAQFVPVIKQS